MDSGTIYRNGGNNTLRIRMNCHMDSPANGTGREIGTKVESVAQTKDDVSMEG